MYKSKLSLLETERAIKKLKDYFQEGLEKELGLERISAPLFVDGESGLNDDLNGIEESVSFNHFEKTMQIVQSLAKWKRMALHRYGFSVGEGLYADLNAIRKDEVLSPIHSLYVDQWDWELIIGKEQRNMEVLKKVVEKIYNVFKSTNTYIIKNYGQLAKELPDGIHFITSQELYDIYPKKTPKEREYEITKKYKAVFITQIGCTLSNGEVHDARSPDYDDWSLNGDIVIYNEVLDQAFELSSMGIRVDEETLLKQLEISNCMERTKLDFHKKLLSGKLPYTIGGGIGQSRLCMYFLDKVHIGEVQATYWPKEIRDECKEKGIRLL
ncbi:aspartate--ammonia ligase [Mycoplasmatota bacterium WC44]